jgi:hypothetical protein
MQKAVLIAVALLAGMGLAVAQDQVPGSKSEAATPAPPAQQNAPPEKVGPGPLSSPDALPPDTKAETKEPTLKMDAGTENKKSAPDDAATVQPH